MTAALSPPLPAAAAAPQDVPVSHSKHSSRATLGTSKPTSFTLHGREYRLPVRPTVAICVDGFDPEYLSHGMADGILPNLSKMYSTGFCAIAHAAMPTFTNPNNCSIITGAPTAVHGIGGNFYLDKETGEEKLVLDDTLLRGSTILEQMSLRGVRVAAVTAKDKLRRILQHGLDPSAGDICFSSEYAGKCTLQENGIENVEAYVGRPAPAQYSGDLSLFVLDAGIALLREKRAELFYLTLSDYIQHKHAPGSDEANAFLAALDERVGQLVDLGAVVGVTGDHGMSDKSTVDGEPNVLYVQDELEAHFGPGCARVVCPITDPFVRHHGALGSFVRIHLHASVKDKRDEMIALLKRSDRVLDALPGEEGADKWQMPLAMEGDIVAVSIKNAVLGSKASEHDLNSGKRRRVGEQPPPSGMDNADDDDNHRMKRVRRDSPPPQPQQGYNDPPPTLFLRPASSLPFPLHPISDNPKRRTVSPQASVSNNLYSLGTAPRAQTRPPSIFNRLVAQDPPRRPQYPFHDPSHIPLPVSREGSVDHSSPGPTSPPSSQSTFSQSQQGRAFHIRAHGGPLPTDQSYQTFGPDPKRKSQERSLPGERQTGFVKRPRLEDLQEQGTEPLKPTSEGDQEVTLGTLAETKKGPAAAPNSRRLLRLPSDASIGSTASATTISAYDPNFKPNDLLKIPLTSSLSSIPSSASVSGQPSSSGSGSGAGAGPAASKRALDLFGTRGRAKNLDYLLSAGPSAEVAVPENKNKPKLGMRDKEERKKVKVEIIREVKERAKEREDEELGNELAKSPSKAGAGGMKEKPYAYAGESRSMKKLLAKRNQEAEEEKAAVKEADRVAFETARAAFDADKAALAAERAAFAAERGIGNGDDGSRAIEGREEEEDDRMDSTEDDNTPQPRPQQLYQPPTSFALTCTPMNTHEDEHDQDTYMRSASDEPFGSFDPSGVRLSSSGRIGRPKRERPGKVTIRREAVSTGGAGGSGLALTGPARSGGNKFSAKFEEEEESAEKDRQEKIQIQPRYEAPSGFSFAMPSAQPTPPPEATIEQQAAIMVAGAAEAPISSLPFSLTKPGTAPRPPAASAAPIPTSAPAFTFTTPKTSDSSTTNGGIPNFFASAKVFQKTGMTPPTMTPPPAAEKKKDAEEGKMVPFSFGPPASSSTPSGGSGTTPGGLFGVASSSGGLFGAPAPATATNGASESSKPAEKPATAVSGFSFDAPPTSTTTPTTSPPTANATTTPAPAPFTFGTVSKPSEKKDEEKKNEQPKNLFGGTGTTGGFTGFGAPAASAPTTTTPAGEPKSAATTSTPSLGSSFSFSQPAATTPSTTTPAIASAAPAPEAPKPLFGTGSSSFSFGQPAPTATTSTTTPNTTEAPKDAASKPASVFSFGAPPATPPPSNGDAKPASTGFTFNVPAPGASTTAGTTPFTFGATTSAPTAAKPFVFGVAPTAPTTAPTATTTQTTANTTNGRPTTPPGGNNGDEMRMEESPVGMTGGAALRPTGLQLQVPGSTGPFGSISAGSGAGFAFGASTTTTPTSGGGFSFGTKPGDGGATPTAAAPFSFGAKPADGGATPTTASPFGFGGQQSQPPSASTGASGGFSFPVTKPAESTPTATTSPFSFGAAKPADSAPTTATNTNPFAFGQTQQPQQDANRSSSSSFSFGSQPQTTSRPPSSGFSFGAPQNGATNDPARPVSAGFGGGFGSTTTNGTTNGSSFPFGAPAQPTPSLPGSNPFGQSSAPASPAFGQSAGFSFNGTSTTNNMTNGAPSAASGAFSFGASQPTTPAAAPGTGFPFGNGAVSSPSSTFAQLPSAGGVPGAGASGGVVFTMGAPPPAARPMRKLPTRRGGKR